MPDHTTRSPDLEDRMHALLEGYRHSPITERKYALQWARFVAWCHKNDRAPLPTDDQTVAAYLAEEAPGRYAEGTIGVILAAIADRHRRAGHVPPGRELTKDTQAGVVRHHPRPRQTRRPLTADLVVRLAAAAPPVSPAARTLRAILVVGHAAQAPELQLRRLARQGIRQVKGGIVLSLPEAGSPGRTLPAREVEIWPTGDDLCPVGALADVLAVASSDRPLDDPSARARLRIAAGHAGVVLPLDPFPGAGLDPSDLWRVWVRVARSAAHFIRDRAYAMVVHCGPFQPSEPLALHGRDVVEHPDGLVVHLPWAPPDLFGRGQYVAIPRSPDPSCCPVAAVAQWRRLARTGDDDWLFAPIGPGNVGGPLDPRSAAYALDRLTERAGLGAGFSVGDLRRGFFHSARAAGESLLAITMAARVKRLETTRKILGEGPPLERRAVRAVGL